MEQLLDLPAVQDYCHELGVKPLHPLVSVVDMSELPFTRHRMRRFGFYCIWYKEMNCGEVLYGRNKYDYDEGTMMFIGPGQVGGNNDNTIVEHPRGWILMFHPDLLLGTPLARRMKDYTFFSYTSNEALHMSEREKQIILNCFREIKEELEYAIDKHTKQIVTSNIETLLNHCVRFYERQFVTREVVNADVLTKFEQTLQAYFDSDKPVKEGLPTVKYCAEQVFLSPNYFGDLVKKSTGKSAIETIQLFVIERAKELLAESNKSISEIAYSLGFNYPHHLTRVFKKVVGETPGDFRHELAGRGA